MTIFYLLLSIAKRWKIYFIPNILESLSSLINFIFNKVMLILICFKAKIKYKIIKMN
jgi:hypothetical protein